MSYTITTTAGVTLATIADGTVNSTNTSLTLIGKNYAGYGIFLNENYVKLLENFYNTTAPTAPLPGQLWYDSSNSLLKVYDGSLWKPISSSASGSTQPASPITGDLWWDSANAQLKVWSGAAWITVGPSYTTTSGTSGAVVETIPDSTGAPKVAVKFYISNTVIGILSKEATYTPQSSIAGFATIKPGFNLINSSTLSGSQFTGDASNALTLQGVAANQFLRSDQNTSTNYQLTIGGGVVVGSDLQINTTSGTEVQLNNVTTGKDLNLYVTKSVGGSTKAIGITGNTAAVSLAGALSVTGTTTLTGAASLSSTLSVTGQSTFTGKLVPSGGGGGTDIGATASRFANVFATVGSFTGNVSAGTFIGNVVGTSQTALYADLAERFEADVPMVPGTVVELGGMKEITSVVQDLSEAVFGVISTLPGFLLNGGAGSNTTHPAVAVNGRVPVRVIGKVNKGDRLVSAGNGLARAADRSELTAFNVLGRALADKHTTDEGLVEAIVKLNS
jgi:hypothetical protein